MAVRTDFRSRGYAYWTATLYVFCDRCGSFDVRTHISLRKWLVIASAFGLVVSAVLAVVGSGGRLFWLPLAFAASGLVVKFFWGDVDYRCRKCGYAPTTQHNTLGYPPDMSKADVPEQLIQKRYLGYWPDLYDLDEALQPPVRATPGCADYHGPSADCRSKSGTK